MVMHAEINCLHNAGRTVSHFRGMTMYSTLMPCHMCAGAIVQFGIRKVIAAESENFTEKNGFDLLLRHRVEVVDLDQAEAKELLARFIERNPLEWHRDIGQDRGRHEPDTRNTQALGQLRAAMRTPNQPGTGASSVAVVTAG